MLRGNGLWHRCAITSDKIRYESIRADTNILRSQELISITSVSELQDAKLSRERSPSSNESNDSDDSESSNDFDDPNFSGHSNNSNDFEICRISRSRCIIVSLSLSLYNKQDA